jgi:hypothetical protein
MKVYLLFINHGPFHDNSDCVAAVYSTLEKAEAAQQLISAQHSTWIQEEEVE